MSCILWIALVCAILIQLGYFTTNLLRSTFLNISENVGNHSTTAYGIYETAVYNVIIVLQVMEYCVLVCSVKQNKLKTKNACKFLVCLWVHRKEESEPLVGEARARFRDEEVLREKIKASWKLYKINRIVATLLLTTLAALAVTLPVLGFYRDYNSNMVVGGHDAIDTYMYMSKIALALTHELFKFGNLFTNFLIRLFSAALCWEYVSDWDTQIADIPPKVGTIDAGTMDVDVIATQARANTYSFYSHYHRSGDLTKGTRKALQSWFVMQYLVYLLTIYTDIVHVVRPVFAGKSQSDIWDLSHYSLYIIYDLVTLFLPYLLALWMIDAHRRYYMMMTESHLLMEDVRRELEETDQTKKYYITEVTTRKVLLCKEFDFSPQILTIHIPVNSPGYTVTILLALFALIANSNS